MTYISVLSVLLLTTPALSFPLSPRHLWSSSFWKRGTPSEGFFNPTSDGGSFLTIAPNTNGLGEPLNVILSANSDKRVLVDQEDNGGMRNYWLSVGFGAECLGQHAGEPQTANLGDGDGQKNETAVLRWNYGDPSLGTCEETIKGGNHFRYWIQNGKDGNSGAVFLATSYEKPIQFAHDIVPDGYNLGRDWLVGNATSQRDLIPTRNITSGMTFSGNTSAGEFIYHTEAVYVAGLASNSTNSVNHADSVGGDGVPAVDGLVAVLTVTIPVGPSSSALRPSSPLPLVAAAIALTSFALS